MELTQYQAVFMILLIFFVGDLVGALTKAKISSMFVIMMGFLVLFLTGVYPADIMTTAGFAGVASLGQYFLLFNMGTSVDLPTLRREWRTVVGAIIGMAAAIVGCCVAIPVIGKDFALAAAPVVNGGIVATTTMVQACDEKGLAAAAALATFIYAVQKFVGTLPASNCGLSVANELVADLRAKHAADPNYSWYAEQTSKSSTGSAKEPLWKGIKKYYTTFICLAIGAAAIVLAQTIAKVLKPTPLSFINMSILCMVFGITARNTGLVPPNIMRDQAKANGSFSFHHHPLPGADRRVHAALHRLCHRGHLRPGHGLHLHHLHADSRLEGRGQQEAGHRHRHVPDDRLSRHRAHRHRDHQRRCPDR